MKELADTFGLATEAEANALLGINKRTAANHRSQGLGPPFVKLGKTIYYPVEGLRDYAAKRTVTPTPQPTLSTGSARKPRRRARSGSR